MSDREHETILIVDDDPRNLKLLDAMLHASGYDTMSAASGREALDIAARALPALVLLDVMMPEMNGFDVAQKLKADARTRDISIIMAGQSHYETGANCKTEARKLSS